MRTLLLALAMLTTTGAVPLTARALDPVGAAEALAARVTLGTSQGRVVFSLIEAPVDSFTVSADPRGRVAISGTDAVAMATGLNWYLKYVAGVHICWNNLRQALPDTLPLPREPFGASSAVRRRYYMNPCTFSYSTQGWDQDRWEAEVDWMALHGVNMPLALVGVEEVWRRTLGALGAGPEAVDAYVCAPAYLAWWMMGNIQGVGGPMDQKWYQDRAALGRSIADRMRELGMHPVLPGFAGMIPREGISSLGIDPYDTGRWCGQPRPAMVLPDSTGRFDAVADQYYGQLREVLGQADYYSMDLFHEGAVPADLDLAAVGAAVAGAMHRASPGARWVLQGWGSNPQPSMLAGLDPERDTFILDLYSEKTPQWQTGRYGRHPWAWCMLLNFGGNTGMHGRAAGLIEGWQQARAQSPTLAGLGATPEGIDNNPAMYELLYELPWRAQAPDLQEWTRSYLQARYGTDSLPACVADAWRALMATVYDCPTDYPGQGTQESLFCGRPSWEMRSASTWGCSQPFYHPDSTARAAALMAQAREKLGGNANFAYDLADIARQANADAANALYQRMRRARQDGDTAAVRAMGQRFLGLILTQDSLLRGVPGMDLDQWRTDARRNAGPGGEANALRLVTTWADSTACNAGRLHDYAHREWAGLLRTLYYDRWKAFLEAPEGTTPDYYAIETRWLRDQLAKSSPHPPYPQQSHQP